MAIDPMQPVYTPQTGTKIATAWGAAVANAVIQVFADEGERDARWTNPPVGSVCFVHSGTVPGGFYVWFGAQWQLLLDINTSGNVGLGSQLFSTRAGLQIIAPGEVDKVCAPLLFYNDDGRVGSIGPSPEQFHVSIDNLDVSFIIDYPNMSSAHGGQMTGNGLSVLWVVGDDGNQFGRLHVPATAFIAGAGAANVAINAANGGFFMSTSSARYKVDIEDLDDERADKLLDMRPVWYRSNPETTAICNPEHSHYGLIAEEVAEIDPRLVTWVSVPGCDCDIPEELAAKPDVVDDEGNVIKAGRLEDDQAIWHHDCRRPNDVNYTHIIPHLISQVQKQKARNDDLEARLAALEASA